MPLSKQQIETIKTLDSLAKQILPQGGEEALLISLATKMEILWPILNGGSQAELDAYCEQYTGFYEYMHLMERVAQGCQDGVFDDVMPDKAQQT
jgi:hypothetical protein